MKRRTYLKTVGLGTLVGVSSGTALGKPDHAGGDYRPGGPQPGSAHSINLSAFHDNEQLAKALQQIERQSDRLSLRALTESAGGSGTVWEATIGEGETNVHLITQIHGDEPSGTEVILDLLKRLSTSESPQVHHILDEITLTAIPRMNPDGAVFAYDYDGDGEEEVVGRRTNTQDWAPGDSRYEPYYHYSSPPGTPPGYDMNRDFNIDTDFDPTTDDQESWWSDQRYMDMPYNGYTLFNSGLRLTPEVRAVTESFLEADPDYAITHHHRGGNVVPGTGNHRPPKQSILATMPAFGPSYIDESLFYPPDHTPIEQAVNPFLDEATSTRSIQLNAMVASALAERGNSVFDSVTRYGYYPLWGSYLDALTPQTDAAGMLYEVSYQTDMIGQKALGRMMQATVVGFLTTFEGIADGRVADVDPTDYFDVPPMGARTDLRTHPRR